MFSVIYINHILKYDLLLILRNLTRDRLSYKPISQSSTELLLSSKGKKKKKLKKKQQHSKQTSAE